MNQLKFHVIDLLASTTHSISSLTLVRRHSFLSSIPKHVPDHIVRDLRSFPIYGPKLFSEPSLKSLQSHTKEYKQEQFQTLKIGKSRRVLVLVPFEAPADPLVESLPEVGERNPNLNLNLNNDVLQEVGVALDLSKIALIPPDPCTLPVGGRLGHFHLNWKFLGALPSVINTLEFGLQLPVGSVQIPLSRVPLINSHYSSPEKNAVLCQAVSDMLLKGAIQEVKDPFFPGFLQ